MATGKKKWRTVKLTKANFKNIAQTAKEFEQYIGTLRGSDSINARESELRHDDWDPDMAPVRKQYPSSSRMRDAVHELDTNIRTTKSNTLKGKRAAKIQQSSSEEENEDESEDLSLDEDE